MCHVRERMISINKFKGIVEVEMRVMIFTDLLNSWSLHLWMKPQRERIK
jgi:hypothetical protein